MTTILPDQGHIDWNSPSIQETMKSMETTYPGGVAGYVKKAKQLLNNNDSNTSTNEDAPKKKRNLKNPAHCVHVDYSSLNSLSQLELGNSIAGNQTVFVIVAGGLGERLGAKSLKLALPVFTCDEDTFLSSSAHNNTSFSKNNFITFYLSWMDHLRSVANLTNKNNNNNNDLNKTPVFIMTSDDTHSRTEVLLNEFFALRPQARQTLDINLIKQSGVPCVCDNIGKLAVTPDGKDFILKPAGHGQVHRLILSSGLIPKYIKNGFKYISFLQDTNAGAPTTIPYSLAVMEEKKWAMSFTCIPRLPGEAIGALVDADDFRSTSTTSSSNQDHKKRRITYCVEYNVLDQLLKEEGISGGDTTATGGDSPYSPFPGTINTLLLSLDQYYETLNRTQGAVAEFINPKYADPKLKTTFKSPARLETLMQDIALDLLDNENSNNNNNEIIIGSCVFDRRTYFPVKNALLDGLTKWKNQGIDPHNGSQGEAGVHLMRRLLWKNFVNINCNETEEQEEEHSSWPLECCLPPAKGIDEFTKKGFVDVVVENSLPLALFPIFISEDNDKEGLVGIARHFMPPSSPSTTSQVKISRKSALVLKTGSPSKQNKIILKSLNLCGSLVIDISDAPAGTEVVVDLPLDYKLTNKGWCVKSLFTAEGQQGEEKEVKEAHLLRGYKFEAQNSESAVYSVDASGNKGMKYVLTLSKESNVPVLMQHQSSSL